MTRYLTLTVLLAIGSFGIAEEPLTRFVVLSQAIATNEPAPEAAKRLQALVEAPDTHPKIRHLAMGWLAARAESLPPEIRLRYGYQVVESPELSSAGVGSVLNSRIAALGKELEPKALVALLAELQAADPSNLRLQRDYVTALEAVDLDKAYATATNLLKSPDTRNPDLIVELMHLVQKREMSAAELDAATTLVDRVLEESGRRETAPSSWANLVYFRSRALIAKGRTGEPIDNCISMLTAEGATAKTFAALILASGDDEQLAQATTVLHRVCAEMIATGGIPAEEHELLANMLLKREQYDLALHEGKILLAYSSRYQQAIDILVAAFKGIDGHMGRLNSLLAYHKHNRAGADQKPGTADDLTDPLHGLKRRADEGRDAPYRQALAALGPLDPVGIDRMVLLHLFLEQPGAALVASLDAFAYCPFDNTQIQQRVNSIAALVMRTTRQEDWAQACMDFRIYGPNGPDRKAKTEDDIADPMEEIRAYLAASYSD